MEVTNMDSLYVDGLRDLYDAEQQLVKALPKVAKAVSDDKLKSAVEEHLAVTEEHVARLKQIFDDLGEKPSGKTCVAMEGLVKEADELMKEVEPGPILDAALIGGAQKVEHYEIAGYGTLRTFAELLGHRKHANLLQKTLDEEGEADKKLSSIAEGMVNEKAMKEGVESGASRSRS